MVEIPDRNVLGILEPNKGEVGRTGEHEVLYAMEHPLGTPQPSFVPVIDSSSRSRLNNVVSGSTFIRTSFPLRINRISILFISQP